MKILDIGCGNKKLKKAAKFFSGYSFKGEVTGLDIKDSEEVDIVCDLEKGELPFKDNEFDIVYTRSVLQYVSNIPGFVSEVHRVLKKGGKFLINAPYFSGGANVTNPHIKSYFSYSTFSNNGYDSLGYYKLFDAIKIEAIFGRFHRYIGVELFVKFFPWFYEKHLCWMFPAQSIQYDLKKKDLKNEG